MTGRTRAFQLIRTPRFSIRWMGQLLATLSTQRIATRYKESLLGFGWIFLQPVALTMIFTYIRRIANIPVGDVPYPLFVATGLVAWSFTSLAISQSAGSITGYATVLKRIAFPKFLLPLSALVASLVDLGVMVLLLIGMFLFLQPELYGTVLWIPVIFAVHLLLLSGLCYLISLANIFARDVGSGISHLLQLWFFASPVFYPASLVPEEFKLIAYLNPMTGILEAYRAVLLFGKTPPWELFGPSVLVSLVVATVSLYLFSKVEGILADLV